MADPLSIIGGIAAILQISSEVVALIRAAKDALSDRQQLIAEINATTALCQTLKDYVEIDGVESWTTTFAILNQGGNGPVYVLKKSLEYLRGKLSRKSSTLTWPFEKGKVMEVLASIERQKSLFAIALTNDNVRLSAAIFNEMKQISRGIDAIRYAQKKNYEDAHSSRSELRVLVEEIMGGVNSMQVERADEGKQVTSRKGLVDVERVLKPELQIEISSNETDVQSFLRQSLHQQDRLSTWINEDPGFESLIINAVLIKLNGMFLLARLYMDLLANIRTKRGIRRALDSLPAGTDNTYQDAWTRINAQRPEQAEIGRRVLSWVIHAIRPLSVKEMQYALAIEPGDEELDNEGLLPLEDLTSYCAGLVVVDMQNDRVTLVHPTTQEYFDKIRAELFPTAHEDLAGTCMTYLCMKSFRNTAADGTLADDVFSKGPLLGYAALNWGLHLRWAENDRNISQALQLLHDDLTRIAATKALVSKRGRMWIRQQHAASVTPLHLAAYFGLLQVFERLELGTLGVNVGDKRIGTPLHWALFGNQDDLLKALLERGADPNAAKYSDAIDFDAKFRIETSADRQMTYPLIVATEKGNIKAIRYLLQHSAEIDRVTSETDVARSVVKNALTVAVRSHNEDATRLLLDKGADVNVDERLVPWTARYGTISMMKMLVDAGASKRSIQKAVDLAGHRESRTPKEMVGLLLEHQNH